MREGKKKKKFYFAKQTDRERGTGGEGERRVGRRSGWKGKGGKGRGGERKNDLTHPLSLIPGYATASRILVAFAITHNCPPEIR